MTKDTLAEVQIPLPVQVKKTMEILEEAGYEAYLVGGAVRDSLLLQARREARTAPAADSESAREQEPKSAPAQEMKHARTQEPESTPPQEEAQEEADFDYDLTTSATPEEVLEVFARFNKSREERELPPVRMLDTGARHGTLTLLLPGERILPVELTSYRSDGIYGDNRHPDEVRFTRSLEEDLARRDYTVNAMAYHPERGLVDLYGGREDLAKGLLRCVGEELLAGPMDAARSEAIATRRFSEDALRILRGLRFAATYGFVPEEGTAAALRKEKGRLENISAERIRDELSKLLHGENAARVLIDYAEVIAVVMPEMEACIGFEQHTEYHQYDVWAHCAHAVQNARLSMASAVALQELASSQEEWMALVRQSIVCLKWAALLHDIEKPACFFQDEEGKGHFYGHSEKGAETVAKILDRLHFSNEQKEKIEMLVRFHDRQFVLDVKPIKRAIRKFGKQDLLLLMDLYSADCSAQSRLAQDRLKAHDMMRGAIMHLTQEENAVFSRKDLAVKGEDLMALGYEGPSLGEALESLVDAVIEEEVTNEKDALLAYLCQTSQEGQSPENQG